MEYLYLNNYTTITYDEYYSWRNNEFVLPEKPIIIAFDDGNRGQIDYAYPIMEYFVFKGVNNVIFSYLQRK
jgi:hypothetical protein